MWLRDGQWDRGVDEGEGAALIGGGFGERRYLDIGGVEANLVAGEGGQVLEESVEAAQRVTELIVFGGGFGLGGLGAFRGGCELFGDM